METKIGTNSCVAIEKIKQKDKNIRKKYCIVIPVYKETLDIDEIISLKRLHDTLVDKSFVYIIAPEGINLKKYLKIFPELIKIQLDAKWFESTKTYSHLCMQYDFYNMFSSFEYMYIYQLDCYLFEDKLEYWCDKGYDYIGGPIIGPANGWNNYRKIADNQIECFPMIGNGGFSLRKISTFKELTDPNGELSKRYELTDEKNKDVEFEDVYFCVTLANLYDINMPNVMEAFKFSIDMNPDIAFENYGVKDFPMAIHAFNKNIPFWKEKVKEFDNQELYDVCYNKYKDFINAYYFKK